MFSSFNMQCVFIRKWDDKMFLILLGFDLKIFEYYVVVQWKMEYMEFCLEVVIENCKDCCLL